MNNNKKIPPIEETEPDADISPAERLLLDESIENSISVDNENLRRSALDNTDDDGDLLNEESFDLTGDDLDIPGPELNALEEENGEDDEENNLYSNADTE